MPSVMRMKLKSFGKKMKKNNNYLLNHKRIKLLKLSEDLIVKYGWNESLFKNISYEKKININEIYSLFPQGFEDMLKFSLDYLNHKLEDTCYKFNLIRKPLHKRINKIIMTKIIIMSEKKDFYKKTFYYLLVPINYKLMTKQLYKSIDLMWHIAGDCSTDFNYYTKRMILSGVYVSVVLNFLRNDDLFETEKILDDNLFKVSKIPKFKNKFTNIKNVLPSFFSFVRNYNF